jgi:hypothetical protein
VVDEALAVTGSKNVLFAVDTAPAVDRILTYTDTLATSVVLGEPANEAIFPRERSVSMSWEALTGATSYNWQIATDAAFLLVTDQGFATYTSAPSAVLTAGRTYYWRVRVDAAPAGAAGSPVLSRWSTARTFTTYLGARAWSPGLTNVQMAYSNQVPLKPAFEWTGADWATGYELVLDDDADFSSPEVSKTTSVTAYACEVSLAYSTTYFWKVRAVSASSESEWSDVGTFITMDKPVAPTPPVVIEEAPAVTLPAPVVEVTEITPVWIWAIIGIGAALVVAVIILIVRTR